MENNAPEKKKKILSCIQPSGIPTLGNYLGALKNWKTLSDDFDSAFAVADLHAITVRQEPAKLRKQITEVFALLLAIGLDPEKSIIFIQSHVPAHSQLAWILNCYTQFGEMSRMTQFKDKSKAHADNVNVGLFAYPVLMAADILLYQADLVPVGIDQKQHLEIARDIANRFNTVYSPTFTVPDAYIGKQGAKIMSLQEPTKKMSKSDPNPASYVAIIESRDDTIRKIKRAVTDSDSVVKYAPGKDGINNLMSIYSVFTGKSFDEIEREFDGKGYGDFKAAVGETCADGLESVRNEYARLVGDKAYLESLMKEGAEKAAYFAAKTLRKVYKKVGFYQTK